MKGEGKNKAQKRLSTSLFCQLIPCAFFFLGNFSCSDIEPLYWFSGTLLQIFSLLFSIFLSFDFALKEISSTLSFNPLVEFLKFLLLNCQFLRALFGGCSLLYPIFVSQAQFYFIFCENINGILHPTSLSPSKSSCFLQLVFVCLLWSVSSLEAFPVCH